MNCLRHSNEKAVRQLSSDGRLTDYTHICKDLKILPLDSLIKFQRATFMWKLNNKILPHPTPSWFLVNNQTPTNHDNESINKYLLPQPRTEVAKRHNTFTATKLWNSELPVAIKGSPFLNTFKKHLKTYLLAQL